MTRITSTTSNRRMLNDLATAQRSLLRAQSRLSSGKELERASDGPARALSALDHRAALRRSEQFQRNASDARGWLVAADTALTSGVEEMTRARTLVIGANSGGSDPNARKAIADELRNLREGMLQLGNSKYMDRPIFAGNTRVDVAFDGTGAYLGDQGVVHRPIAEAVDVQVNRTGTEVFGVSNPGDPLQGNVFEVLDAVITAVESGDPDAMAAGLARLDVMTDRMEAAQVELGARARQVDDVMARNEVLDLDRKQALSEVEDVDVAQALIDVRAREFTYQAALSSAATVMQVSLLDFLR
jgi:flagellar hook-associated protein 3 FlgL